MTTNKKQINKMHKKATKPDYAKSIFSRFKSKLNNILKLITPPIFYEIKKSIYTPKIPDEFSKLPRSQHGLYKLIKDYKFNTVLDVGSGSGEHAEIFHKYGKSVTALDFGTSIYSKQAKSECEWLKIVGNFYEIPLNEKYDCIWASHVLEHQPDAGLFIRHCIEYAKENGIIAITVPPLKNEIVGGHLSLWNAGLLLYQLVFNGLDCKDAAILTYGYNITIITRNKKRAECHLDWDSGDITRLRDFFPEFAKESFDGRISRWNW